MCGIVALSLAQQMPGAREVVARMLRRVRHRGPDNTAVYEGPERHNLLGHARLSINDLSVEGNQPLWNEDDTLAIIVNGEIYNYPTLRNELEARGHRFRSRSDSEVILHLYEDMGTACVERLEGMYAFVLLDTRSGDLFCARDRIGEKPLVYAAAPAGVAISSEIPAVREFPGVNLDLDRKALALYLLRNFRHIPDPYTIHRGVRRLEPGHCMIVSGGKVRRVWRYWHPQFKVRSISSDEVRNAVESAVRTRLLADVEIGALLSGGVDSTAILAIMNVAGTRPVATYALGSNPQDSELLRARHAAGLFGAQHHEFYFDPELHHDLMLDLWKIHGDPVALLPLAYAYDLCRQVRANGIKVVLTGHGADEIFYGYSGFVGMAKLSRVMAAVPAALMRNAARVMHPLVPFGSSLREALIAASAKPGRRKSALYRDEALRAWPEFLILGAGDIEMANAIDDLFDTWIADEPPKDYIDESAIIGLMHENAHSVTIAGDLPAMAAGVEARCPFLDRSLVELAWQIDYQQKVGTSSEITHLKLILKKALADIVPAEILYAPKQGFGFNIQEKDVFSGAWKSRVDFALDQMADLGGIFRMEGITKLRTDFTANPDSRKAALVSKLYSLACVME